jgi:hypothetical protein
VVGGVDRFQLQGGDTARVWCSVGMLREKVLASSCCAIRRNEGISGSARIREEVRRPEGGRAGAWARRNRARSAADTVGSSDEICWLGDVSRKGKERRKRRGSRGFYSRLSLGEGLGFGEGRRDGRQRGMPCEGKALARASRRI